MPLPYDVEKLLSDSKYGQVLSLFQEGLLLSKLTVGLTFFFHVVSKFLLCSVERREREKILTRQVRQTNIGVPNIL